MRSMVRLAGCCIIGLLLITLCAGCYEETGSAPAPQSQAPPASGAEDPHSTLSSQGGGSALGGAKRAAGNVVQQAEQRSERDAREADPFNDDKPKDPDDDE